MSNLIRKVSLPTQEFGMSAVLKLKQLFDAVSFAGVEEVRIPAFTFGQYTSDGDYSIRFVGEWDGNVSTLEAFLEACEVRPARYAIGVVGMNPGAIKHHRVVEFCSGGNLVM